MGMNSRERVHGAINHQETDRVPIDLGSSFNTGIHASTLTQLRRALGLGGGPVKLWEPFQCLGWVDLDLINKLGVDLAGIHWPMTFFGYRNEQWKPWRLPDGTDVLVGKGFMTTVDENGYQYIYPGGDTSAPASGVMPRGGFYFDPIIRQKAIDEISFDPKDFAERFGLFTDEALEDMRKEADFYWNETDLAMAGEFYQGGFGNICRVAGMPLKNPKGICDPELWLLAHYLYPDYIMEINEIQREAVLKNLEMYRQALGDRLEVIMISGSDFGGQQVPMISPQTFRDFYKPYLKSVNDWIHSHTAWKTFYHSCGAVEPLIEDFIESGMDILNPVQTSCPGMEPENLKQKYGDRITFWGGGVDTQRTLPFGTPDEVRRQVAERIEIFSKGGGFVFNTIHNIQPNVPVENIIAMFEVAAGKSIV